MTFSPQSNNRRKHMKNVIVKELTKAHFDALVAYSRNPSVEFISVEIDWYADAEERVIGTVLLDPVDSDYAAIVLARDKNRRSEDISYVLSKKAERPKRDKKGLL